MKTKFLSLPIGLLIFFATTTLPAHAQTQIPTFPDCQGFGCETPGGRGGKVVFVTNLNDSGPGSFREALMMTEPRIIVFKVSGTIHLKSDIELGAANSYVTVAGQTAPGDGIAIAQTANNQIEMGGYGRGDFHDAVFQHLRIRGGYRNVVVFSGSSHIVFDHNSFTWATDQHINLRQSNIHDITWSWNIIGEGPAKHNAGSLFSGNGHRNITLHHNYLAHTRFRNYKVDGGRYDFINNVNYNTLGWDYHIDARYGRNSPDIINHYFKEGPDSSRRHPFDLIGSGEISLYLSGNKYVDINENPVYDINDQATMAKARNVGGTQGIPIYTINERGPHTEKPHFPITVHNVDQGKDLVLVQAGPRPLDAVDARILKDFFDRGGHDPNNLGKFPELKTYNIPKDSDNDGMPDDWEVAHDLNPNDGTDHNKDRDGDGYTNIEEWINSIGGESPPPDSIAPSPPQNVEVKVGE